MYPFEILNTVKDAYRFLWRERAAFIRLASPAIVILTGVATLTASEIVYNASLWLLGIMFAVAWCRRCLVPDEAVSPRAALRWGRRQFRWLWYTVKITAVIFVPGFFIGFAILSTTLPILAGLPVAMEKPLVAGLVGVVIMVGLSIALRLSLVLPASAVDQVMSFRECWRRSPGMGWRLLLAGIPASAPALALDGLAMWLTPILSARVGPLLIKPADTFLATFLYFLGHALWLTVLSKAYQGLAPEPPVATAHQQAVPQTEASSMPMAAPLWTRVRRVRRMATGALLLIYISFAVLMSVRVPSVTPPEHPIAGSSGATPNKQAYPAYTRTVVLGTFEWDVESGEQGTDTANADFYWEQPSDTERYLVPINGAKATLISGRDFDHIDARFIEGQQLSSAPISGSNSGGQLSPGAIVVFRTVEGNLGKLRVDKYRALHDFSFPETRYLSTDLASLAIRRPDVRNYHLQVRWQLFSGVMKAGPELSVSKTLFYENRDLNLIPELKLGKFGADRERLMIVGDKGACQLTLEGQPVRCISYPLRDLYHLELVELDKRSYAFVADGGWGEPSAVVMDPTGKVQWRYDAKFKAMGKPAVIGFGTSGGRAVVVYERGRGLVFFDFDSGKPLTTKQPPTELRGILATDSDGDGQQGLLAYDMAGRLTVLTSSGEVLASAASGAFHPVVTHAEPPNIVIAPQSTIFLLDGNLNRVASWDAPGTGSLHLVAAEPLGPKEHRNGLITLFAGEGSWHKTLLFVHAWDGKLLYKEILQDDYLSLLPLPTAEQGPVAFLAGGRGQVWRYSLPAAAE